MSYAWMAQYEVIINGKFDKPLGYLAPLNGGQIAREITRISADKELAYKDVTMVRRYE